MLSVTWYQIKCPSHSSLGIAGLSSHTFFRRSSVTTATPFQNKSRDSRPEFFTVTREGTAPVCLYSDITRVFTAYSFCKPTLSSLKKLPFPNYSTPSNRKQSQSHRDTTPAVPIAYSFALPRERRSLPGYREWASQHSSTHLQPAAYHLPICEGGNTFLRL